MTQTKLEDWPSASFDEAKTDLRKWREENIRRSEETVEIWEHVISRRPHSLGDEVWIVYEQVFIAALDCARLDIAQECLAALYKQFPESRRVLKLQAMRLETMNKFNEARECYDRLIKDDESNPIFRKRKIAILKTQGKIPEAIRELNEYLTKFMNDSEAWLELATLYLSESDYSKAAYCVEELILAHPRDHLYYQLYAEVKYSQGGRDNLDLAKSYYSEAVKLNPENVRALWGLFTVTSQLAQKESGQKKKELINLISFASDQLAKVYKKLKTNADNSFAYEKHVESIEQLLKTAVVFDS
uniref:ER membrane protein complex subunit 2 n=1 Tax=Romanomermis culicivorax TaxID=13658 RepID=A0A915JJR7_ROMCU